jgi:archaemetzincin
LNPSHKHTIAIIPLVPLDKPILDRMRSEINRVFQYNTVILPLNQDLSFSYDVSRMQYHSTAIMEKMTPQIPSQAIKAIAIVEVDLFIPILTHVYGEAQMGGKMCIVSTYRLKDELPHLDGNPVYCNRVVKESIHELGHTFNLRHCPDQTCIMHYCRTLMDVDRKSDQLCRYCQVLLEDEKKRLAEH